ncbi:MAG TPA: beta-ketoacyl synthase N-terminal-like domain-containing protein, partial [Candidatus Polarisedimenticolaceae bacterium]|nr:beta-ketoacyl synthase N-terminal-like domain-containing protein [Candidatus Polarisedimenticolaceae bacterium]
MSSNNGHMSNGGPPRRRIVVTGIGAISPNGIGREAYWKSLRCGRSGVDLISQFPTDELSCQIAGEVKNFRAEDYLPPQELRRVGRAVPLLLAATGAALTDAGIVWQQLSLDERRSWGVVVGSGGGTPDFTEEQYRLFFSNQMRKVS